MVEKSKVGIVQDFIWKEVKAGRIKNGQRLPSCREVSSILSINKITVNKAYNELEKEHKVYSIPRGGFYLMDAEQSMSLKRMVFMLLPIRSSLHTERSRL